ncbi:MAG: ABC transporter permease subunit [Zetaproteobacteria bacterium]|nr:ABC transporter permease subunit [Zetaproteobacteria bacterium]
MLQKIFHLLTVFSFSLCSLDAYAGPKHCGIDRKINFGALDWQSNSFHVEMMRYILEHGYGCTTDAIPGTSLPLLTALGRGDIDILMEVWLDNTGEAWNKPLEEGKVVDIGISIPDATQGFYVPTYMVQGDPERKITALAPKLRHVRDLPKYWKLFQDPEENNKGRFYNCVLGWTCEGVNNKKITAYGLDAFYTNFRPGTGGSLSAAISSHYERGEPFFAYYWGPTWIMGKYKLTKLEEPEYDPDVWQQLTTTAAPRQATAYPVSKVHIGVNRAFQEAAPEIVAMIGQYQVSSQVVSQALAYITAVEGRTPRDAALHFLQTREDLWSQFVPPEVQAQIKDSLPQKQTKPTAKTWQLEIGTEINRFVKVLVRDHQDLFDTLAAPIRQMITGVEFGLLQTPIWLFILLAILLAYQISRDLLLPGIVSCAFTLIWILGLWEMSMQTLALMLISTFISVWIGLPLGILMSYSLYLRRALLPILDAMQTMPSFVYLIPALMLFGLGKVPAVFATVIYAVSPLIRLTDLGIRQVNPETLEAARSFGASRRQLLYGVQLPLALPTIMAGINQTTMLALSMVVIASMIGARGLGEEVLLGIQKLDIGRGFTAGLGIVALAVIIDRMTQGWGKRLDKTK